MDDAVYWARSAAGATWACAIVGFLSATATLFAVLVALGWFRRRPVLRLDFDEGKDIEVQGGNSMWVRLMVANLAGRPIAKGAKVFLVGVQFRPTNSVPFKPQFQNRDSRQLVWTHSADIKLVPDQQGKLVPVPVEGGRDLLPGIPRPVDLLDTVRDQLWFQLATIPHNDRQLRNPGDYLLELKASAEDTTPAPFQLLLVWQCNWERFSVRPHPSTEHAKEVRTPLLPGLHAPTCLRVPIVVAVVSFFEGVCTEVLDPSARRVRHPRPISRSRGGSGLPRNSSTPPERI